MLSLDRRSTLADIVASLTSASRIGLSREGTADPGCALRTISGDWTWRIGMRTHGK